MTTPTAVNVSRADEKTALGVLRNKVVRAMKREGLAPEGKRVSELTRLAYAAGAITMTELEFMAWLMRQLPHCAKRPRSVARATRNGGLRTA